MIARLAALLHAATGHGARDPSAEAEQQLPAQHVPLPGPLQPPQPSPSPVQRQPSSPAPPDVPRMSRAQQQAQAQAAARSDPDLRCPWLLPYTRAYHACSNVVELCVHITPIAAGQVWAWLTLRCLVGPETVHCRFLSASWALRHQQLLQACALLSITNREKFARAMCKGCAKG